MIRFVTLGNDSPKILKYNLQQLARLYPESEVILYDWGHKRADQAAFKAANPRLVVRPWIATPKDYMLQKVACIHDCFAQQPDQPLVYMDADVILMGRIEVFASSDWDIGATWRPDTGHMREVFGVGTWLNDGVVFIHNERPEASLGFLQAWVDRCEGCRDQSWWIDQVELIRLYSEAKPDLSAGPDREGVLELDGLQVRLHTLDAAIYNHLPEPYQQPLAGWREAPKLIHLKSGWRKAKFGMAPGWLKAAWLGWIVSDYAGRPVLKRFSYGFNALLRFLLAKGIWPK